MKMSGARLAAVAVVGLGLGIGYANPASAQVINQRQEYYQARWDWKGVHKSTQDPNNISFIQFKSPTQAVYCYKKACRNVKLQKVPGGDLTFSVNGKDYFEMNIVNSTRINGRFWTDMTPPARSPDATAVFVRKP
ncbi:hypothetical protein RPB_0052 [Rhodopseudomonas palustris HaA2]|uniref:Uncharacterized protein n=1 Tax=Rhodopseudomonas palustris (strain HaA2) TaxID=316058 RepID=Q2J446_RHOP2|nr:hypothetical protein [Rhodopseudomonas palustris]ABD04764.1 hypothetical protein RPB_0052 [Rhodopseudomonas palustris HaA2]